MDKLKIGFLVVFFIAGSVIVIHLLYINKFIWNGSAIHIFHSIDILSHPVNQDNFEIGLDGALDEPGQGTQISTSKLNSKKGKDSIDLEVVERSNSHTRTDSISSAHTGKVVDRGQAFRSTKSVAKGSFRDWLQDSSNPKTVNKIAKNAFGDDNDMQICPKGGRALVGLMYIEQSVPEMENLEKQMSVQHGGTVEKGGWWKPSDCKPRAKVALVLPYRNREQQLKIFLRHLHPVLQRQLLDYRIIVVEQAGQTPFNRAGLFNVGFKEALKLGDYNCFVFSDVDLLPEDDRNNYGCPTSPRHMSVAVDKFNYQLPYATIFGGVGAFTKDHFTTVNGFSNRFWGWGGEDDDLYNRITGKGFTLTRPSLKIGRYTMIKVHHFQSHGADPNRMQLLQNSLARLDSDGLSTLRYTVKEFKELPLVTIVTVDIERT